MPVSAALALDHDHDTHEPGSQASPTPSAPQTPAAPKKRGRPRSTPLPKEPSPFTRWVTEDRKNDVKGVAAELGVDLTYVYCLMKGTRSPSSALAIKICKLSEGKLSLDLLFGVKTSTKTNT